MSARRLFSVLSLPLAVALSTSPAQSACGKARPTYTDIEAVRYERTGCFGKCPTYQVLFSNLGCYYVGIQYVPKHGTYKSACSTLILKQVSEVLKTRGFYDLNYNSRVLILDTPHYIVSVERCGVTTTLDWPSTEDANLDRKDIRALFDELDIVTRQMAWRMVSGSVESPLPLLDPIPRP
jgi:Domain of unknown function (DUF6438)